MKPIRLTASNLTELREKYTCLARLKYGNVPHISKAVAKELAGAYQLPNIGYELTLGVNDYGCLFIHNLSGDFFVETYMDVNRQYKSIPAEWKKELTQKLQEAHNG